MLIGAFQIQIARITEVALAHGPHSTDDPDSKPDIEDVVHRFEFGKIEVIRRIRIT